MNMTEYLLNISEYLLNMNISEYVNISESKSLNISEYMNILNPSNT